MKTAQGTLSIANGRLVDGTGTAPVADATVVAKDGRIVYAGPAKGAGDGVQAAHQDGVPLPRLGR